MVAMGEGTYPQGAYVGIYVGLLILAALVNLLGTKATGIINKFIVGWALIGTIIIVIAMPAMAPSHQSAKWVFTEFINNTGYANSGLVFLLGMLQAGWTLIGYETSAQIVEETHRADIAAPRGIIVSIIGAWIQGLVLILAVLFSIQDADDIMTSTVPIARLFYTTTGNNGLTVFFLLILLGAQLGSLFNSILACGHLIWAMARDGCLPYSSFFYKLSDNTHAPVRAIMLQLVICVLIIMPSFGSTVFWQAIMSTAVIAVNISYGLPFFCRLMFTRNTMQKGPFSLGKYSIPINIISLIWISFFAVILCFPSGFPVFAVSMNYASLMVGAVLLFALFFWIVSGRHFYKGPMQNADN
ncbi:amino acid/polyamine transporter I [Umbelopsis sp. PMI_123]|nr:amino acid/polyamine transporter I [Umbelopsis sp. PMI_123]